MGGITEKLEKLREAEAIYEEAKIECSMASAEEASALNKLNDAQRAFDAEVDNIKYNTPGGDWRLKCR